ncbi:MAG: glycosyltransferase [Ruminococcaceae bacterium]|nr:glycosyltransferase [Oscillospiraceae bacterium]
MNILIVNNNMEIGGIQKSLVNLLSQISADHNVTLMLFSAHGDLMDDIPQNVTVKTGNAFTKILGMSQSMAKSSGVFPFLWRSLWAVFSKIFGVKVPFWVLSRLQKDKSEYDVAISFMQNSHYNYFYGGTGEYVLNSVSAKKKIAFVHCDFENYFGNNSYNIGLYRNFDKIACVSHSVKAVFDRVCPQYADKTCTVHNMYDFGYMEKLAGENVALSDIHPIIFSSSRVSREKGILRMIPIFASMKELPFIWYIAGEGEDLSSAIELTKKYGLSDKIIFLGQKKNPYPYFRQADFVLVPSFNEAAPMVFAEAFTFATPVFTTDTTSAKELVADISGGWVATEENLCDELYRVIKDELYREVVPKYDASNKIAIEEFENMIK